MKTFFLEIFNFYLVLTLSILMRTTNYKLHISLCRFFLEYATRQTLISLYTQTTIYRRFCFFFESMNSRLQII